MVGDHLKLPEDLLFAIFLRSFVKSLLRAKCVCKQWYVLIRNTNFVLSHLQYQKSHNKGCLLLQHRVEHELYKFAIFDDETLDSNSYRDLDHVLNPLPDFVTSTLCMDGPVNGLYCLFNGHDRIILWNPALMEVRIIPLPQTHFFPHHKDCFGVIGFGRNPFSQDYKLILIQYHFFYDNQYVTLYNLNCNTWKFLDHGNVEYLSGRHHSWPPCNSSFINGVCYWWNDICVVVAFDMGEETFRQILGPGLFFDWHSGSLTIYYDNISFSCVDDFSFDVWVMLEEGVWLKQISITSLPNHSYVAGLWKNNGLLVAVIDFQTDQIDLCNANTQERRNMGPKGRPFSFHASIYYESLV